jgi:hypothetical protein
VFDELECECAAMRSTSSPASNRSARSSAVKDRSIASASQDSRRRAWVSTACSFSGHAPEDAATLGDRWQCGLMLNTPANPGGTPIEVFDRWRANVRSGRMPACRSMAITAQVQKPRMV